MCGIFGALIKPDQNENSQKKLYKSISELAVLSESRGKEASGFCTLTNNHMLYMKQPVPATTIVRTKTFKNFVREASNLSLIHI